MLANLKEKGAACWLKGLGKLGERPGNGGY
jgi:hypothetical protein